MGFNRNPASCITYRWAVWKTSDYDSDRMMHLLVKITPLMLPPYPFHLLCFCPFLMTSLRNCLEGSESFLCLCTMGSPQGHGECLSHLGPPAAGIWAPGSPPHTLAPQPPRVSLKKAEPSPVGPKKRNTSTSELCIPFLDT